MKINVSMLKRVSIVTDIEVLDFSYCEGCYENSNEILETLKMHMNAADFFDFNRENRQAWLIKTFERHSGKLLIAQQPEKSLSIRQQTLFVATLVAFANYNNNKLLITTQSSPILEAVNNHVCACYLHETNQSLCEKICMAENMSSIFIAADLSHKDFGYYKSKNGALKLCATADKYGLFFKDVEEAKESIRAAANCLKDAIFNLQHEKTTPPPPTIPISTFLL